MLVRSFDYIITPSYELVIEVSDGGIDGEQVLTSTATVTIAMTHINEYVPQFDNGGVFQVTVEEESSSDNILTVNSTINCLLLLYCSSITCTQVILLRVLNAYVLTSCLP